jgi:hypothetical protein
MATLFTITIKDAHSLEAAVCSISCIQMLAFVIPWHDNSLILLQKNSRTLALTRATFMMDYVQIQKVQLVYITSLQEVVMQQLRLYPFWLLYVPSGLTLKILRSVHTVYLFVLCGSDNKQRLFHFTTLTDWFL